MDKFLIHTSILYVMDYGTLLITSNMIKAALEFIKALKKKEKGIITIKEVEADPTIEKMLGKSGNPEPHKILVEVKVDDENNDTLGRIKQQISESGKVLGITTMGPYKYVKNEK
ncbi:MAG: hypothetical protein WBZ36_29985 [Candidatus Nitrosopolaris sp.]